MNCDILKIVRGNDFATQMTITALDAGGNVIEDFSLEDSTDVVVKYTLAGNSHTIEAYDYDIDGNDVTIQWSDLTLGKYGFEIEGKFNGYSWRSAARFIFQIVADNASANIPDGVLVNGIYILNDWLRLLSGTGGGGKQVQADWDETDTSSPAYIQNKPDFAPVATSGSYNDLTNKPTIPDVSGKADKVSGAVSGDFAALDANGNLTDSGKKASDFATAAQGAKADTAVQDISGKQDVLVSGTNIKTINNESILGSGNITIEGGGAVESVNGQTGVVVLDAEDVGALPDDTPIPEELTTVNVSVDGNVGTPSGSATISGNTISFEFSNLKGATGAQGPKGDTVILGDGEEYTLYNVTGQNTDGAMTQKAATDNFPIITDGSSSYDLDIADGEGNVLVQFSNGGIKTKNFNSEYIEWLQNLQGATELFVSAMRNKASKMGLAITINGPTGYPDNQVSDARSMAKLFLVASSYRELVNIWNTKNDVTIKSKGKVSGTHILHSSVFSTDSQGHYANQLTDYYSMLGGKTGTWSSPRYNMIGGIFKGPNDTILSAWLRRNAGEDSSNNRWHSMKILMDIAFAKIQVPSADVSSLESALVNSGVNSAQVLQIPNGYPINYELFDFYGSDSRYINFAVYGYMNTTQLPIASTTKVLTAITVLDYISDLERLVEIVASDIVAGSTSTNPEFSVGEKFTVRELLLSMMLPSSNAAANALARYVGSMLLLNKTSF